MKKFYLALIVLIGFTLGCGLSSTATLEAQEIVEKIFPTDTPTQTSTPFPTNTPKPTNTPRPTQTPTIAPTSTPIPEPITLMGSGNSVVDIQKWEGAAVAKIIYSGSRNFIVYNFDSNGNQINLLVNTIGAYQGTVPIDFYDDEQTTRFEVKSSGNWEIQILPFIDSRYEQVPGKFSGKGDDVVLLLGNQPDLLIADASNATRNFIIWAYSNTGTDLVVNDIAPYQGTSILDKSTFILEIKASGDWTIEITSK